MIMTAGLGFKLEHLDEALTARNPGLWFEVHAENYMVDGGPRLRALVALAERFAISLHASASRWRRWNRLRRITSAGCGPSPT